MSPTQETHSLERTSPMGEKFVGTCVLCGKTGLSMGDALKPCTNPARITSDDAVLAAIGDATGPGIRLDGSWITSRYGPGPGPDVDTMCKGECEGMGRVPIQGANSPSSLRVSSTDEGWQRLWDEAHAEAGEHECDGWHFVVCPDCHGTGKRLP